MEKKDSLGDAAAAAYDSSSSAAAAALASVLQGKNDTAAASASASTSSLALSLDGEKEWLKCQLCKRRLGRRNCSQQACVQCCTDPNCTPHIEARQALKNKQSLLDGTDAITQAANKRRASKVNPGAFCDDNIQYFGETVVIWDVGEFMKNQKWREDAVRRSRNKQNQNEVVDLSSLSNSNGNSVLDRKQKRKRDEQVAETETVNGSVDVDADAAGIEKGGKKKKKKPRLSRKKRFEVICHGLYQKSLMEK